MPDANKLVHWQQVAASLVHALGMPSLVARNEFDYEAIATQLISRRHDLRRWRGRVASLRTSSPLFDALTWVRDTERMHRMMWDIYSSGPQRRFPCLVVSSLSN
mmetsp:Transcript_52181/g.122288  ORF Transcript_52181/g.122288 Transcript_52181/m.122288 type:complete len:104 (-) Transcript_52181:57-368(-)